MSLQPSPSMLTTTKKTSRRGTSSTYTTRAIGLLATTALFAFRPFLSSRGPQRPPPGIGGNIASAFFVGANGVGASMILPPKTMSEAMVSSLARGGGGGSLERNAEADDASKSPSSSSSSTFSGTGDQDTEWGRAVMPERATRRRDTSSPTEVEDEVDVAIVGGGLAGLSVAIGLTRRCPSLGVKLYERAPALRSVSQGILCVNPNGNSALRRIHPDLPDMVTRAGCERHRVLLTSIKKDGTVEKTLDEERGRKFVEKYGRIGVGITWHNMQQVLASLLPDEVVVTGKSLSSYEADDCGRTVLLRFEDGSAVRARVAVACDGIFSAARGQMFAQRKKCLASSSTPESSDEVFDRDEEDDQDRPIYFGQLNWATIVPTSTFPRSMHPPQSVHAVVSEKSGYPRFMAMLNDAGSGYTFFQFRVADPTMALSLSRSRGRGGLGLPGTIAALLPVAEPSEDVTEALRAIPESNVFERSIVGRTPAPGWVCPTTGRVALCGDAAHGMHPNIGQGANSAYESAAALVDAIVECHDAEGEGDDADDDWATRALALYERRRKPRADLVQRFANYMGCLQSAGDAGEGGGAAVLTPDERELMSEWILSSGDVGDGDEGHRPSAKMIESLESFDPCSRPGVKYL